MIQWIRAHAGLRCGACGDLLEPGDPVAIHTFHGSHARLVRCESCIKARGGDAAPDLDPLPARPPDPPAFTDLATLAREFKRRQAGEP
jgi:hypothetical protein